ncbi:MAG: protein kinase, partial [Planctomycetota bacterium]|nr:protein kinase [Planctomycetota bacterium]
MSRPDKSLPILARIVLQRGLAKRQQIDEVLASRLYDPSISLSDALLGLADVDKKQLDKLIKGFLKEDKRFSSLLLSMGLINQSEYDNAVQHQKQQSQRGILVRASSLLERAGVEIQIGGYRLVECLGSGAMGAVFSARDLERSRPAAVKIVRPDVLDDETSLTRFLREAKTMMNIQHPNVVAYKSSGQDKNIVYIVFELVSGQNLRELLTVKKKLSVPQAITLMADLFGGLQAVHDAGVIHRDLKPDNILLSIKGIPKITDFGLARRAGANESLALTLEGSILGTPHYMSPEQCRGEEATFASDLYAMGALFYHLIAGKPPFPGRNLHIIIENHIHENPPDPRDIGAPKSVAKLILQLMAKKPAKRGQSAGEVSSYLKELISQGFTEAIGEIEDTTDSKILTNDYDVEDSDEPEPDPPEKVFAVKGAEIEIAPANSPRLFRFPKKLAFVGVLMAAMSFGFTFLSNDYPASGPMSKEELQKFVSQEFKHYNELKSQQKYTEQALGQLNLLRLLKKDEQASKLLDQRCVRGLEKSLTSDRTNFHRELNRQRRFEPILKEVLPEIDESFKETNFQGSELRLEALDQLYGYLPEIEAGIARIKERETRSGQLQFLSLDAEVDDAINHFRWQFAGLIQNGQFQEAANLAWNHYLRYGNRKDHGLELIFAFGKASVAGKVKRENYRFAGLQERIDLFTRLETSFFARVGPKARPQTWAVVLPALIALLFLSYVALYCLILGSGRAYTFLRWGLWIRLALGRNQPGRAAAIAEKAGWHSQAGDFYIEAKQFAFAAQVFMACKQERRAAGAYERGNKFDEASSIYEQIGDLQKAAELQLKGENWDKAGSLFYRAKSLSRAAEAYSRGGQIDKAAEILSNEGRQAAAAQLLADDYEIIKSKGAPKTKSKLPERAAQIAKLFSEANYPADAAVYFHEAGNLFEAAEHFVKAEMPREAIELYVSAGEKNIAIDLLHQLGDVRAASLL